MCRFVYVDGFNLYYGALRKMPWRWLLSGVGMDADRNSDPVTFFDFEG